MKRIRHFFHYFDISGQGLLLFSLLPALALSDSYANFYITTVLTMGSIACWQIASAFVRCMTGNDPLKGIYLGVLLLYLASMSVWHYYFFVWLPPKFVLGPLLWFSTLIPVVGSVWYLRQCLAPSQPIEVEALPADGIVPDQLELRPLERLERKRAKYVLRHEG